jgi:hypothetical protein
MLSRRKAKRVEISVPLHIKLLGMSKQPPTIETVTRNISPVGISMDLPVTLTDGVFCIQEGEQAINLIHYLVLENKEVEVEITIPLREEKIKARGKIIWYDFGSREGEVSYHFVAGILLKARAAEDRKTWEVFARKTAWETGKIWNQVQIMSAFTFVIGIVIFIAGFYGELKKIAKAGVVVSLIALIGFVIAWWQHRSFMHLKKFKLF